MAVSLESQGRVRQKAREILKDPGIFYALKAFFLYMSIEKKNVELQLIPYTTAAASVAGGELLNAGALTLYAAWGVKQNTAVDAFLWLIDDAVDDAGLATDGRILIPFMTVSPSGVGAGTVGDEQYFFSPNGVPFATGLVAASNTTPATTTPTNSATADAPVGFVIVGA